MDEQDERMDKIDESIRQLNDRLDDHIAATKPAPQIVVPKVRKR